MMYWEYYHEYENILLTAMVENLPKNSWQNDLFC
jgi:hypothetical protein